MDGSDWIGAANDELARLATLEHYDKRRATIIALVDARIAGHSEESVWEREDTCSRNTYHRKKHGWKYQPLFMDVLANVQQIAREWKSTEELRALREASRKLALASPDAADKAVEQLENSDPAIVLRAAFGILDRAGQETAQKSSQTLVVSAADRIAAMQRALAAEVGAGD